jgi:hypothetical protein
MLRIATPAALATHVRVYRFTVRSRPMTAPASPLPALAAAVGGGARRRGALGGGQAVAPTRSRQRRRGRHGGQLRRAQLRRALPAAAGHARAQRAKQRSRVAAAWDGGWGCGGSAVTQSLLCHQGHTAQPRRVPLECGFISGRGANMASQGIAHRALLSRQSQARGPPHRLVAGVASEPCSVDTSPGPASAAACAACMAFLASCLLYASRVMPLGEGREGPVLAVPPGLRTDRSGRARRARGFGRRAPGTTHTHTHAWHDTLRQRCWLRALLRRPVQSAMGHPAPSTPGPHPRSVTPPVGVSTSMALGCVRGGIFL